MYHRDQPTNLDVLYSLVELLNELDFVRPPDEQACPSRIYRNPNATDRSEDSSRDGGHIQAGLEVVTKGIGTPAHVPVRKPLDVLAQRNMACRLPFVLSGI